MILLPLTNLLKISIKINNLEYNMLIYRLMEYLTGQTNRKHKRYISYKLGQNIKILILRYIIKG